MLLVLREKYNEIENVLEIIINDEKQSMETSHKAMCWSNKMKELEIAFLTIFWNNILCRINSTSEIIQRQSTDLSLVVELLTSLEKFI